MRVFKKIMYIILALLPILPLIIFTVSNIGGDTEQALMPFGRFNISVFPISGTSGDGAEYYITYQEGSLSEYFFDTLDTSVFTREVEGTVVTRRSVYIETSGRAKPFALYLCDFYAYLKEVGLVPNVWLCVAVIYFTYLFMIEMAIFIFDLLTFIPRKCSEFFGG